MSAPPFLIARDLARQFGKVQAVDGVSFEVGAGQVVGLIGANGAGKTTLMRILATLDLPDRGTIHLNGINVVEKPTAVRRRLGWMPDHVGVYRDTTVGDYLDFYGRAHGFRDRELVRRLGDVIEFTELGELLDRPADALSKGQTQRLSLARTLLNDPEFLILDEPAAGLDPKARLEFKNLVRLLRARGKTLLISSHILSELGEMCDSLLFMDRGRMVHQGDTDSLRRRDAVAAGGFAIGIRVHGDPAALLLWLQVRPGWRIVEERRDGVRAAYANSDPVALAGELRRLTADGIAVTDFHREERRLEEAFVEMLRSPALTGIPVPVATATETATEP
jgi:ABC-2 type transport system ATP-binding protein